MRRFSLILVLFMLVISATTCLASGQPKASTVAEAKASGVDTNVVLSGHIVKKIQANEFIFSDGTGELLLYIDDADMQQMANETNVLDVEGVIVRNFMYTEVKVDTAKIRN